MNKLNLMFLGGASVYIDGSEVGYTRGISWTVEREVENFRNQKAKGFVGRRLLNISATIRINLLEASSNNLIFFIPGQIDDDFHTLLLIGSKKDGNPVNIYFPKVKVEDCDTVRIGKEESVFGLTFRAFIDEEGNLISIT